VVEEPAAAAERLEGQPELEHNTLRGSEGGSRRRRRRRSEVLQFQTQAEQEKDQIPLS
jgi:hypothetical protein